MNISHLHKTMPWNPFALIIGIALNAVGIGLDARTTPLAKGIHPDVLAALTTASLADRITRGMDHSPGRWNVHDQDGRLEGNRPYTAAVDLSTRTLTDVQIREVLARLTAIGFVGWYRKPGRDGWPKRRRPHIHAVWVGCHLKPRSLGQVVSWLADHNGLALDSPYAFWQPTQDAKDIIRR